MKLITGRAKNPIASPVSHRFKFLNTGLLLCCAVAVVNASWAETASFEAPRSISGPNGQIETWGVSSVDINNDYCADLFFGNHRMAPTLYLGNCDGTFESRPDLLVGDNTNVDAHSTVFGDFQGTGCSDAHISVGGRSVTNPNHANQLLLGRVNANGECTGELIRDVGAQAEYPEQRGRSSVPLDADYDGDLDLVTTGYITDSNGTGGEESLFINDGTGELSLAPASIAGEFDGHGLTIFNILADIDGDDELDLICGESSFPDADCSKNVRASFASGSLLSQDVSLNLVRSPTPGDNVSNFIVDGFAEDIDGDGDNDIVALRRGLRSGNAARRSNNTVVEALNTTAAISPMRCLAIPGEVDIDSFVITGDYFNSRDIKFGESSRTENLPNQPDSSVRRYEYRNLLRTENAGLDLPNITDGVNEDERGTYIGYIEAEQVWRICDVTGSEPAGTTVSPAPRRRFNKYGFRIEFSGQVGELVHEGYDPESEPLRPTVWINNGDSGNGTEFRNLPDNGGIDQAITAFGLGKGDFDNDGDMDFIASYENHGVRGSHYLYSNDGSGNFERTRFNGCPTGIAESVAIADVNDDGKLDPVISCAWFGVAHQTNHAHSVWINNTDNNNNAIMFSLVGNNANPEGIGARIRVTAASDRSQTLCSRDVGNTFGRGSQDSEFVHCGVARRSLVDVIVDWPGDLGQTIYNDVNTSAFYRLEEGSNTAELIKPLGLNPIANNPPSPAPALPIIEVNFNRVDETDGVARMVIRLDNNEFNTTNANIEVDFVTTDITATGGQDYESTSGTATIAPGTRFYVIEIPILTDDLNEDTERFSVQLSNPVGATINSEGGVVQIDNVDPVVVQVQ